MTTRLKPSRHCREIRKSRCDFLGGVYLVTGEHVSAALRQTSAVILVFLLEPQSYFAGKKLLKDVKLWSKREAEGSR